jgi:FMN-dependent NADH-azoreductase
VKLLEIQSSPRGESSDSITLTKSFIETCKTDTASIVVDTLNVWHERLPEFDYEAIGAKYKAVKHETMTEAESNVWERIQPLIPRFRNADRILLGTPMWNFGLPYKLKQLIDLVAQRNYLFAYDGKQYGPLLNVERQSSSIRAVHVSWRVLLSRRRDSITKQPIWTLVAPCRCSRSSNRDC